MKKAASNYGRSDRFGRRHCLVHPSGGLWWEQRGLQPADLSNVGPGHIWNRGDLASASRNLTTRRRWQDSFCALQHFSRARQNTPPVAGRGVHPLVSSRSSPSPR